MKYNNIYSCCPYNKQQTRCGICKVYIIDHLYDWKTTYYLYCTFMYYMIKPGFRIGVSNGTIQIVHNGKTRLLKWKCRPFEEITLTVYTESCQNVAAKDEHSFKMTTFPFQCLTYSDQYTSSRWLHMSSIDPYLARLYHNVFKVLRAKKAVLKCVSRCVNVTPVFKVFVMLICR